MANRLTQLSVDEVSAVDKGANGKRFLVFKAAPRDAQGFTAADYAYAPHAQQTGSWKLRLTKTPGGEPDPGIVGAACAALGAGFRGNKVDIPAADLPAVKAKVRAAWIKANPDKQPVDMPEAIRKTDDEKSSLLGWVLGAFRKAAGHPGPDTEVDEMTAEEIQKAVADGAAEALAPINDRIAKLEAAAVAAPVAEVVAVPVAKADEVPVVTPVVPEAIDAAIIAKLVKDGIVEAIAPIEKRLLVVETAQGARQSSLDEGAHKIVKSAGDMWEGSGLLV